MGLVSGPIATVLVVDDVEVLRAYVTLALEGTGRYSVVATALGREALTFVERAEPPFAAVVLDCELPDVDGLHVLDQLHRTQPALPVIVVSADADYEREALERGARSFLEKVPGRYGRSLLTALDEIVDSSR